MVEIYSNKNIILIIRDEYIELNYLGTKYSSSFKSTIIDTIVDILNHIKYNSKDIHKNIINIINIMEPPQQKTIKYDGFKFFAE